MVEGRRAVRLTCLRAVAGGIAAASLCAAPGTAIGAPAARQTFIISGFDSIRVEAPVDVRIETGKGPSARATGDRRVLDALTLDVNGSVLAVRMRRSAAGSEIAPDGGAQIILTTTTLSTIMLLGAGSVTADRLRGADARASLRGSGRIDVTGVDADRLSVDLLGAGSLTLAGKTTTAQMRVSGAARLDAARLATIRLDATVQGSADVVASAREEAKVVASGSGRVAVAGAGSCSVRRTGSASVECGGKRY